MKQIRLIAIILSLAVLIGTFSVPVFAADQPIGTLTVSGNAVIRTVPDLAGVTFAIKTFAVEAIASQEENKTKSTKIYAELDALAIDKKYIKTQSYTIKPICETVRLEDKIEEEVDGKIITKRVYRNESVLKGYETVNTIAVTVIDVDIDVTLCGKVIDLSIANGANQANGVSFALSDEKRDKVYLEALGVAVDRVNQKVQVVTTKLGVTGLKPRTINIDNISVSVSRAAVYPTSSGDSPASAAGATESFNTPISPGETSVSANVAVIYNY